MWVNTYNMIPAGAPFGGYKQSGIGQETHKVILEHYTQQKNIMINLNETPSGFYRRSKLESCQERRKLPSALFHQNPPSPECLAICWGVVPIEPCQKGRKGMSTYYFVPSRNMLARALWRKQAI